MLIATCIKVITAKWKAKVSSSRPPAMRPERHSRWHHIQVSTITMLEKIGTNSRSVVLARFAPKFASLLSKNKKDRGCWTQKYLNAGPGLRWLPGARINHLFKAGSDGRLWPTLTTQMQSVGLGFYKQSPSPSIMMERVRHWLYKSLFSLCTATALCSAPTTQVLYV